MQDFEHEYETTLNGGVVTVYVQVTYEQDDDNSWSASFELTGVYFEGVDVTSIIDKNTQNALEMEVIHALAGDDVGDFNPSTDAHRLGD